MQSLFHGFQNVTIEARVPRYLNEIEIEHIKVISKGSLYLSFHSHFFSYSFLFFCTLLSLPGLHTITASQTAHQNPVPALTTPNTQPAKRLERYSLSRSSPSTTLKIETTSKAQELSAPASSTLPTPIHPTISPSDGDYTNLRTSKFRSRSRRHPSSTESTLFLPFHKEISSKIPSGSRSSTFELPYHPAL